MKQLLLFAVTILLLTSCSKESTEVCGNVEGGGTRFNPQYGFTEFYLVIDGNKEWVDEKTYDSFFIGDYICIQ